MNSKASEKIRQNNKEQAKLRSIERLQNIEIDKRAKYGYKTTEIRRKQYWQLEALEMEYAALDSYLTDYAMELYSKINNLRCRL